LLSKADKLSKAMHLHALHRVRAQLPSAEVRLFSNLTRQGVDECRDLLESWLAAGRGNKRPPVKGM